MKDGSAVLIGHYEGKMYQTHRTNGIDETKIYEGNEGYSEKYSSPWESVFGLVKEVKITPKQAEYHLVNDGVAELYAKPTPFGNFKSVDWVYHDKPGDKVIQLHGSNTHVRIPKDGIDTGVDHLPKAEAVSTFEGKGGFTRYYLHNGDVMDVLPSNPSQGIIRKPGEISFYDYDRVGKDWTLASYFFKQGGELPQIEMKNDRFRGEGVVIFEQPYKYCVDAKGTLLPIVSEEYPGGLLTKWGLATQRKTFWTGESDLTIKDSSGLSTIINLDRDGNRVIRDDDKAIVRIEPEPASYPDLNDVLPPRSH
jgi:hypothetical protein